MVTAETQKSGAAEARRETLIDGKSVTGLVATFLGL